MVASLLRGQARPRSEDGHHRGRSHGRSQRLDPDAAAGPLPADVWRLRARRDAERRHFVSRTALEDEIGRRLGLAKPLLAVSNTRGGIGKKNMIHNAAMPKIDVNPETYEVRADGEILTCEPAEVLPMAQRYFLY